MPCSLTLCIALALSRMGLGHRFSEDGEKISSVIASGGASGALGRSGNLSRPHHATMSIEQRYIGHQRVQNTGNLENDLGIHHAITPTKQNDIGHQLGNITWNPENDSRSHHAISPTKQKYAGHQIFQNMWKVSALTADVPNSGSNMSRSSSFTQYGEGHLGALSVLMFHRRENSDGVVQVKLVSILTPSIVIALLLCSMCACYFFVFKREVACRSEIQQPIDKSETEPGDLGGTPDDLPHTPMAASRSELDRAKKVVRFGTRESFVPR